jgi:hypothetical protein
MIVSLVDGQVLNGKLYSVDLERTGSAIADVDRSKNAVEAEGYVLQAQTAGRPYGVAKLTVTSGRTEPGIGRSMRRELFEKLTLDLNLDPRCRANEDGHFLVGKDIEGYLRSDNHGPISERRNEFNVAFAGSE